MYTYAIIQADSFRPHRARVAITRYALRMYGADLGPSPYVRKRKSGVNPVTLATATSGSGCPAWLAHLAEYLQSAQPSIGTAQIMAQNARGR